jgi:hypothetical protein
VIFAYRGWTIRVVVRARRARWRTIVEYHATDI